MVLFADGMDYSVLSNLMLTIEPASARRHCVALSILQDMISEGMEQFELYFENLPNESAGIGTPATTCINIIDDDGMHDLSNNMQYRMYRQESNFSLQNQKEVT